MPSFFFLDCAFELIIILLIKLLEFKANYFSADYNIERLHSSWCYPTKGRSRKKWKLSPAFIGQNTNKWNKQYLLLWTFGGWILFNFHISTPLSLILETLYATNDLEVKRQFESLCYCFIIPSIVRYWTMWSNAKMIHSVLI